MKERGPPLPQRQPGVFQVCWFNTDRLFQPFQGATVILFALVCVRVCTRVASCLGWLKHFQYSNSRPARRRLSSSFPSALAVQLRTRGYRIVEEIRGGRAAGEEEKIIKPFRALIKPATWIRSNEASTWQTITGSHPAGVGSTRTDWTLAEGRSTPLWLCSVSRVTLVNRLAAGLYKVNWTFRATVCLPAQPLDCRRLSSAAAHLQRRSRASAAIHRQKKKLVLGFVSLFVA